MYKNSQITTQQIEETLIKKHAKDVWFRELRLSSGFALQGRIDFLAIKPEPSKGNEAIAYEIKISKSDFKRDTHKKQRGARLYSDKFFYIAPKGVIDPNDIPDWAGFLEVAWHVYKYKGAKPFLKINKIIEAPKRDKEPPSWGLVVSMIRNSRKEE